MTREELEIALDESARRPPEYLVDMRDAYRGAVPETARQVAFVNMMNEDFPKFIGMMKVAEREWREAVAALDDPRRLGKEEAAKVVEDAGSETAVKACEEWLKELAAECAT